MAASHPQSQSQLVGSFSSCIRWGLSQGVSANTSHLQVSLKDLWAHLDNPECSCSSQWIEQGRNNAGYFRGTVARFHPAALRSQLPCFGDPEAVLRQGPETCQEPPNTPHEKWVLNSDCSSVDWLCNMQKGLRSSVLQDTGPIHSWESLRPRL